jgi:hypothetical protein
MTGRREKFDAARKEAFLDLLRKGVRRGAACRKVGIARQTFDNHVNKSKSFKADVMQAEMDANELVETALFRNAIDGNVTAQQVWLYNRVPETWQDKRNLTIGGDKNNPIIVEWEDTRTAILGALDNDPDAKQRVIEALEQKR